MYYITRKTLTCNSLVQKMCMFLQKETSHCKNSLVLGPQGPKQYIFGNYFYSNNVRKLRSHVFLLANVRKYTTSSFYLKWMEFTKSCEFCFNYGFLSTQTKLEQIHKFLWIWSTSGKMINHLFSSNKMK